MISKPHLGELYNRMLQTYNRDPKDGEFDAWMNVLGGFGYPDIDAALRRWQNIGDIEDFTQKPKGARMPAAIELRNLIQDFDRSNQEKFSPCGKDGCEGGWIRVFSGRTAGGNPVDPKDGAVKRCKCFYAWAATKK